MLFVKKLNNLFGNIFLFVHLIIIINGWAGIIYNLGPYPRVQSD